MRIAFALLLGLFLVGCSNKKEEGKTVPPPGTGTGNLPTGAPGPPPIDPNLKPPPKG